jgi:hypothetical protein
MKEENHGQSRRSICKKSSRSTGILAKANTCRAAQTPKNAGVRDTSQTTKNGRRYGAGGSFLDPFGSRSLYVGECPQRCSIKDVQLKRSPG